MFDYHYDAIQGQTAQRFISNATTNGVQATKTADLFHIKPGLNLDADGGTDITACIDVKDCVCVYCAISIYHKALIRVFSTSQKAPMPDIVPQQLFVFSTLSVPPLVS